MGIADDIIERQQQTIAEEEQGGKTYVDELGLPVIVKDIDHPENELKNNIEYIVARIFKQNYDKTLAGYQGLIHKRNNQLFMGNEPIDQTDDNLMRLCKTRYNIPAHIKPQVWERVFDLAPVLSYDRIIISKNLAFNNRTGELEWSDEPFPSVGVGGF